MGTMLGALGLSGGAFVKEVAADHDAVVFVTLPLEFDLSDEDVIRLRHKFEALHVGPRVVFLPAGTEVKLAVRGVAYQRERLAEYEYEASAESEAVLRERLVLLGNLPKGGS